MTGKKRFSPDFFSSDSKKDKHSNKFLTLHNDDINPFDYVIDALMDICGHDEVQAEQCAYLAHYKGKCEIKKGSAHFLKPLQEELLDWGLDVTIE
jgi:ATP-dependent Clp protease adaptor protein ClpS